MLADNGIPQPPPQPPGPPPQRLRLNIQRNSQDGVNSRQLHEELHSDDFKFDADEQQTDSHGQRDDGDDAEDDGGSDTHDDLFEHKPSAPTVSEHSLQWFMYNCSKMLPEKAAYGCQERQEAAMEKSATFFANEHALSMHHGKPQVVGGHELASIAQGACRAAAAATEYDRLQSCQCSTKACGKHPVSATCYD